jgi:acetolactate synthase I/II/III large subunit
MGTEMTGADIVVQALTDLGVEVVFGYPGGAVLPIYDALFKQGRIRHILVRHEQAAVHAAEGYARASGKVGVVLVTSGPGATNASPARCRRISLAPMPFRNATRWVSPAIVPSIIIW